MAQTMRVLSIAVGVLMILLGGVWIAQGINILPGSFMTGDPKWAVIGAGLAVVGGWLIFRNVRKA
jgi:hypothetical protein